MEQTNEMNCPLASVCKQAGNLPQCTASCTPFIAVSRRYATTELPTEYRNITLDNSPAKADQSVIYERLETYVKSFAMDDVTIKNLYLLSESPGTGKTTTAAALINEYVKRRFMYYVKKKVEIPQELAAFLDLTEWQNKYNLATMTKDEQALEEIKDDIIRYSEIEFLVLDDIGVRSATEAFRGYVHTIINKRITNARPTVFTSNVPMTELSTIFDSRLYDRVRDQCITMPFDGTSKRGRR
ncbi:ATP-binding protein [Mammaliicoccus sp. JADD-157]|uniref:ATP-binding protein n=1 Tax=Mammaliicoccus sp. JADD-157 TaxID=3404818 RepID=UPI003BB58EA1